MVSPAKKISKQEWERHDHTIHNLYHVRGLPLHSENGNPGVQQIMRDEHQFSASISQYETYFEKRDRPKNLKKEEWRAVHAKLSELSAMGIENRVSLSGRVLSRQSIERRTRYAFSGLEQPRHNASDRLALPPPHRITIEILGADGEWSAYTGVNTVADAHPSLPANDHVVLEPEESSALEPMSEDKAPFLSGFEAPPQFLPRATNDHAVLGLESSSSLERIHEHGALSFSSHELPRFGSPLPSWNDSFYFGDFGSSVEMGGPWSFDLGPSQLSGLSPAALIGPSAYETPFIPQYWTEKSPFSQLQTALSAKSRQSIHFQYQSPECNGAGHERDSALSIKPRISPKILVESLLQDAARVLIDNSMSSVVQKLPDSDDTLDSLLSLLPESLVQDNSGQMAELAIRDIIFDSPFYSALLFSITNGYAGLGNIPSGAVLRMLRKQPQMSSRLFEYLRSCPPVLARPLADNLFRAAVEACDEQAVIVILQATRNSPNAIDPNEIACELDGKGRLYTPIELAAKFRNLGIVQTLLAANADVNKTYEQDEYQERGALELAIRKWGKHEAVDMKLVRTLLDCHAEVRVHLAEAVIRWGQEDLLRELISQIPPASHRSCFKSGSMLKEIAKYFEINLATQIIKQLFEYCQAENCMRCPADHQKVIESTLCNAIMRGNFELVEFLLCHATKKDGALSAAVRNGSRKLIDLLFQHGASVGGPIYYLDSYADSKYGLKFYFPTTPLAEAIRSQDKDLVREFENLEALSHINEEGHFEAAISAAAEVGDCHYMQTLLERVPEKRGTYLTQALNVAIRNDETKAALILLDNGADVNRKLGSFRLGPPLLEALRRQNKVVVEGILEADVHIKPHLDDVDWETTILESAALWGDISIAEDLIFMGTDIDAGHKTTALAAAVTSRNRILVELLLKCGASPSKCARFGLSPLKAAMNNEDDDMIQLLISCDADPANAGAFFLAIENHQGTFITLTETFCARYPQGKKGFGGGLLIKAIEKEDDTPLNIMLIAKFDVNSFSRREDKLLTALGFAIMYKRGRDVSLVQKLINAAGGDPNGIVRRPYRNCGDEVKPQETALMVAIKTRHEPMVELLLRKGANVHRPARRGLKRTPLQQACEIGSFKMVKLLLDNNATVNELPAERGGGTALQLAAISGSIKIAKLLLAHGALVHASPAKVNGRTALEGAAEHGCIEMIRVLWDAVSGLGFTPEQIDKSISLAKSRGHRGCAEYIAGLSSTASFPLL